MAGFPSCPAQRAGSGSRQISPDACLLVGAASGLLPRKWDWLSALSPVRVSASLKQYGCTNQIFVNGVSWSVVDNYALGLWERIFGRRFSLSRSQR